MQIFFELIRTTIIQLLTLFGLFFILGYTLTTIQRRVNAIYSKTTGWKGILFTAWVGTPIHELGHIVLAKLFGHRLKHVSFFEPNQDTGGLGHVEHAYNPHNIYHQVGNFFIGAAPILGGSLTLLLLLQLFFSNTQLFTPFSDIPNSPIIFFQHVIEFIIRLINIGLPMGWKFWLFIYLSFAVAAHMAPSSIDLKGMWKGFVWIVLLVLLINVIPVLIDKDITAQVWWLQTWFSNIYAVFFYAIIISFLHYLILLFMLELPFSLIKRR